MKHAYLIMAHNEFEHLQRLIDALDDERNDIYVHIDRKVKQLPELHSNKASLHVLENRVDVRWGHLSQLKAEHVLLESAYNNEYYEYYHLISGTHFPLKPPSEIYNFFHSLNGRSILSALDWTEDEIRTKLGRYHFFIKGLKSNNIIVAKSSNILWRTISRLHRGWINRDFSYFYEKCSNWMSITHKDLKIILYNWDDMLKKLKHTFCPDEIAIPAILHKEDVIYICSDKLLFTEFHMANPKLLCSSDYDRLISSGCIFARKFSNESKSLTDRITRSWSTSL